MSVQFCQIKKSEAAFIVAVIACAFACYYYIKWGEKKNRTRDTPGQQRSQSIPDSELLTTSKSQTTSSQVNDSKATIEEEFEKEFKGEIRFAVPVKKKKKSKKKKKKKKTSKLSTGEISNESSPAKLATALPNEQMTGATTPTNDIEKVQVNPENDAKTAVAPSAGYDDEEKKKSKKRKDQRKDKKEMEFKSKK
ncbi:hypothetical protein ACH3XW_22010 [Acanthocheilonema viteae]